LGKSGVGVVGAGGMTFAAIRADLLGTAWKRGEDAAGRGGWGEEEGPDTWFIITHPTLTYYYYTSHSNPRWLQISQKGNEFLSRQQSLGSALQGITAPGCYGEGVDKETRQLDKEEPSGPPPPPAAPLVFWTTWTEIPVAGAEGPCG
jgi:hypothetical protein